MLFTQAALVFAACESAWRAPALVIALAERGIDGENCHEQSGLARTRAKRSNCVEVRRRGTMEGSKYHRENEIFTEHREIDRLPGRRYSRG